MRVRSVERGALFDPIKSGEQYKMKGEYFYIKRDFKRELENYILAKKYANNSEKYVSQRFEVRQTTYNQVRPV